MKSIKIDQGTEIEIEIRSGVVVVCRPITTLDMAIAQATARRLVDQMQESAEVCIRSGLVPQDAMTMPDGTVIDLSEPDQRAGFLHQQTIDALALRQIVRFKEGVCNEDGTLAEKNEETVRLLMSDWPNGERFYHGLTGKQMELLAAKKGYGVAQTGTSAQVPAPNIATDAEGKDSPAPEVLPASMDSDAPT